MAGIFRRQLKGTSLSVFGRLRLWRVLASIAIASLCSGCFTVQLTDFNPKRGQTCDEVKITGTIFDYGHLDGVWFNSIPAPAQVRKDPPPSGPNTIFASVPEGATTGPLRASISSGGAIVLGVVGEDHTFATPFVVTNVLAKPAIVAFAPAASAIKPNSGGTTLSWTTSGTVTQLSLNGVDVTGATSAPVDPTVTTTYSLIASNRCLSTAAKTAVTVLEPLHLSLSPTTVHVDQGQTVLVTATIPQNLNNVQIGCAAAPGLTCQPVTIAAGATTGSLQIYATTSASFGTSQLSVTAEEEAVGGATSSAALAVHIDRELGDFAEVKSAVSALGQTATSGACSGSVVSGAGTADTFQAQLKCGSSIYNVPFDVGGHFGLGGVGFSQNSGVAVVVSYSANLDNTNFIVTRLPSGVVARQSIPAFAMHDMTGSSGTSAPVPVRPQIFVSPDSSLALVLGANPAAPPGQPGVAVVYDLSKGTILAGGIQFATSISASVANKNAGQVVDLVVDGAPSSVPIP